MFALTEEDKFGILEGGIGKLNSHFWHVSLSSLIWIPVGQRQEMESRVNWFEFGRQMSLQPPFLSSHLLLSAKTNYTRIWTRTKENTINGTVNFRTRHTVIVQVSWSLTCPVKF